MLASSLILAIYLIVTAWVKKIDWLYYLRYGEKRPKMKKRVAKIELEDDDEDLQMFDESRVDDVRLSYNIKGWANQTS